MQGLGSRGLGFGSDPAHLDDFGIVRLHEPLLLPLPLDSPLTLTPKRVLEPAGAKTERLGSCWFGCPSFTCGKRYFGNLDDCANCLV